jgi:hypothetical protein
MANGVNPTDCHVVDILDPSQNSSSFYEISRDLLHGFLSTAAIMTFHL